MPSFKTGMLICFQGRGKGNGTVALMDGDEKIWSISGLQRPKYAEQLPNGNVLVAEYGYNPYSDKLQVTERTPENKIVWTHVAYDPVNCFRLDDGRTVVAAERKAYLVDRSGEIIRTLYDAPRQLIRGAGMLPNNTLGFFRSANQDSLFIEVDLEGNVLRETVLKEGGATGLFAVLPNGHLLIPMTYRNRVIELDANRKPLRTFAEVQGPIGVQRLPGGNIVVTTGRSGITTFDAEGNQLESNKFDQRILASRYYSRLPASIYASQGKRMAIFKSEPSKAIQWLAHLGAGIKRDKSLPDKPIIELDLFNYYRSKSTVTDDVLEVVGLLRHLKRLNVANSRVTDQGIAYLANLKQIEEIDLSKTAVTDEGLKSLAGINSLKNLRLNNTTVGDGGLKLVLNSNPNLEQLDLDRTEVTDNIAEPISTLVNLKTLTLPKGISNASLKSIARMKSLESLSLSGDRLSDDGIVLLSKLVGLKKLALKGTQISDAGLKSLTGLAQVHELNLAGARKLTPEGLKSISRFRKIRKLVLYGCRVNDESLEPICTLGYIEELQIQGTAVTNRGLKYLANAITLQHLYLQETRVTAKAIRNLELELPYCRITYRVPAGLF